MAAKPLSQTALSGCSAVHPVTSQTTHDAPPLVAFGETDMNKTPLEMGLVFAAAIGSGLVGGTFYAFSSFVMAALGRIPPAQGVAAMKGINVTVMNPSFMTVFMGTGGLCLLVGVESLFT